MSWPHYSGSVGVHPTPNKSPKPRHPADVELVVVHYTGSTSLEGALAWLGSAKSMVSAHHVVDQDGAVHTFADWSWVLWHAGPSLYQGRGWCNTWSVGIECVGTGRFTPEQYQACGAIITELAGCCPVHWVAGHEHVAPGRKVDPGPGFDWTHLQTLIPPTVALPI